MKTKSLKVEMKALDALVPYVRNARTHSAAQVAQIAASVREFGWTSPILVASDGTVIAGHGRLLAARQLEMQEVPCIVLDHLTESQRRALVIADNRLALSAGWDEDMLAVELQQLVDDGFAMPTLGFDDAELAALLSEANDGLTDPDATPELSEDATSVVGDVWVMGNHRLICGDSTDAGSIAILLAGVKPGLMVTDPPYGVEYDAAWRTKAGLQKTGAHGVVMNDDRADWREAWDLFPGDVAYVWHAPGGLSVAVAESLRASGFELRMQIIWAKTRMVIGRGHYHMQHEPCWYAVRKGATASWAGDRKQTTLWSIEHRKSETGHSTQKPVERMKRPVENHPTPGQSVFEPFSGSGTTIIACEMTGRHCFASELNPPYVDMAVQRWQQFTGRQATLEGDGRTFDEVRASRQGTAAND